MATQIQIQRSTHATNEPTLQYGELGYSTRNTVNAAATVGGGYLWIGDSASPGSNLRVVGGDHYVRMMNHALGTLTASSAILTDANSKVDNLKTTNITVGGTDLTFGQPADIIIPNGSTTAFDIQDGTDTYMSINTSTNTINFGKPLTGAVCFVDSTDAALTFTDASGASYLEFDSSGNKVCIAQALDIGSNALSMSGAITAGNGTFCQAAATVTIQNTETENTTEGGRETQLIFADNSGNEMARIRGEHDGTANDAKGNLKLYTGAGGTNSGTSDATEALEITSAQKTIFKGAVDVGTSGTAQNLTVYGNFDVKGTTTTIDSTTVTVDDHNIELGHVATPTDATADGGGITLKGDTDKTIAWDNTNDSWDFNQKANLSADTLDYRIADVSVLTCDTLGSNVVTSSLTTVGALNSGSITSGFGNINNGSSSVSTGVLNATGLASLDGGINVDDAFIVADTSGNVTTSGTLDVTGNGTVGGTLGVTGATTLGSTLTVNGNFETCLKGALNVDGATCIDDTLEATGNATVGGTLGVTGATTLGSTLTVNGNFETCLKGALNVDGAACIDDTLEVTGNTTVGGTLGVTGATNLGVLNATGLASLDGGIHVDDAFTVADTSGNVVTTGSLNVSGAAAFCTDITLFDAQNDANPTYSMGSSATNALTITSSYSSGAQTLQHVKFDTPTTLGGTDAGEIQFWVDGMRKYTVVDGGVEGYYVASGGGATTYTNPSDSNLTSGKPYLDNFTVDGGTFGS